MKVGTAGAIDLVEAAYDLDAAPGSWLPNLLLAGEPLLADGIGCIASMMSGEAEDGQYLVTQFCTGAGAPEDFPQRYLRAAQSLGPDVVGRWSQDLARRGVVALSETKSDWPAPYAAITEHMGCKDGLSVPCLDADSRGVFLSVCRSEVIEDLGPKAREQWRMLGVHISAGYRLRSGLTGSSHPPGMVSTDIPLDAEALLDPRRFVVAHAAGPAQDKVASSVIREAAVQIDRARGKLRRDDPSAALTAWQGLVEGRWSLVDWFDTDGRRFVLAKPNAPHVYDPRGLTKRERQVATYASLGDSNKLIGYRFGLSRSRVSALLTSAMRKLGVKTRAQLVETMRALPRSSPEN